MKNIDKKKEEQHSDKYHLLNDTEDVTSVTSGHSRESILQMQPLDDLFFHSKEVVMYVTNDNRATVQAISGSISIYGYSPDDFATGEYTLYHIIHPDDLASVNEKIAEETDKGSASFKQEYRVVSKSGEPVWVMSVTIPEYNRKGQATHFLIKIRDINERKQFEDNLQDINRNLFAILKSIGEAVIMTDADGYIEQLNDAAKMLTGIINIKAKGKLLADVMLFNLSENFDSSVDLLEIEAKTSKMVQYDIIFVKCNYSNESFRASCSISPIYGGKYKNVLTGYVLVVKDLTAIYDMFLTAQENNSTMRSIFDHSVDGILLADHRGIIKEWSSGYEQILGVPKKEAIGKTIWEVISTTLPPQLTIEERMKMQREINQTVGAMQQKKITRRLVDRQTGELRIVNVIYFPVVMPGKMMLGAICRDVTDEFLSRELLSQSRRKLKENYNLLESIMKTIPTPLFVKNTKGVYIECNDAFSTQIGLTRKQVMGKTTAELFPEISEAINEVDRMLLSNDNDIQSESRITDLKDFPESIIYRSVFSNNDEKEGIVGVIVDISELKDTERKLIVEKDRLGILFKVLQILQSAENIPHALSISLGEIGRFAGVSRVYVLESNSDNITFSCTYEWCNEGIASTIGEMQNRPIDEFRDWYETAKKGEYICTSDIFILSPATATILEEQSVLSVLAIPLISDGIPYGFVGFDECKTHHEWEQSEIDLLTGLSQIISTATRRHHAKIDLILAKEKAEEADKLKSAFLANMSHEIRTPLNGIIGFLNLLTSDNLTPERRHEYIAIANNSCMQLTNLIDDIIDIAKIEVKQLKIHPVPVHINSLMKELQVFFETFLQSKKKDNIAFILDESEFIDPCHAYVDPARLRQVLNNLIGNAIKFTDKGYIRFGYSRIAPDVLEFTVEDSGIGIPQNQLDVIFERFRQVEANNNRHSGTGLGLTISRNLVQMMGGDMQVESIEGIGSIFRFTIAYLPVRLVDDIFFDTRSKNLNT